MENCLGPVAESERIASLDVLRGFALLGILVMNIQSFAMPFAAYFNPTAYGNLEGVNYRVWLLSHLLADQKMMTIFSMLFGAGICLFTSRVERRGLPPGRLHFRRMVWLLLFGLAHAYLLWYGDILVLYAVCGLLVYAARNLSPRTLLLLGVFIIAIGSGISLVSGWSMPHWPPSAVAEFEQHNWRPPQEALDRELAAYRGSWLDQMEHRVPMAWEFHSFVIFIWGLWRAGGLMLVGMALFKLGVFSAERSRAFYLAMAAVGAGAGIPLILRGVANNHASGWDVRYSFFFGAQWNYWGSLLVSLAWVGLVVLVFRSPLRWLAQPFAAVGRMAFTNYLLHTILATSIFYGHGLGLFGEVTRSGQIATVFSIWAFQLMASPLWLRFFRLGPFEWAWRSLTYGQAQPLRRRMELAPAD
jgi:uncharacterized protein